MRRASTLIPAWRNGLRQAGKKAAPSREYLCRTMLQCSIYSAFQAVDGMMPIRQLLEQISAVTSDMAAMRVGTTVSTA